MSEAAIHSYKDLVVWKKSVALSVACYPLTRSFPKHEAYGMSSQIRRASMSGPANIGEGDGREHTRSFMQALRVAQGPLKELETHLIFCEQVQLASVVALTPLYALADEVGRMLRSLIRALEDRVDAVE